MDGTYKGFKGFHLGMRFDADAFPFRRRVVAEMRIDNDVIDNIKFLFTFRPRIEVELNLKKNK